MNLEKIGFFYKMDNHVSEFNKGLSIPESKETYNLLKKLDAPLPEFKEVLLRIKLLKEELGELNDAYINHSDRNSRAYIVESMDAVVDINYLLVGLIRLLGVSDYISYYLYKNSTLQECNMYYIALKLNNIEGLLIESYDSESKVVTLSLIENIAVLQNVLFEVGKSLTYSDSYKTYYKCFREVHRSNMTKLDKDGNAVRRPDGKVIKSELFEMPDLETVLWG